MQRIRTTSTALAVAALAAATVGTTTAHAAPAATTPEPGAYVASTPTRLLDTRTQGGALGPGTTRQLDVSRLVPTTTATAVVLNLTVTEPTAAGFVTVYPAGGARPGTSSINERAGETRSNSVTVALPANGSRVLDLYNLTGRTQVVVDGLGFYDPAAIGTGATYHPVTPYRLEDTRPTGLGSGIGIDVQTVDAYTAAHHVTAVATTITALTGPRDPSTGFLTAWNGVGPQPTVSTVNYGADHQTPNFAVVPVTQNDTGAFRFRVQNNSARDTQVLVDILGYYSTDDASGSLYVPVTPTRVTDTRTSGGALGNGEQRCEAAGSGTALPATATGVNLNVTAVGATAPTFLTVQACGQTGAPVSTLNPADAAPRASATQPGVGPGAHGAPSYSVLNHQGAVDVVADLQGWFVPAA